MRQPDHRLWNFSSWCLKFQDHVYVYLMEGEPRSYGWHGAWLDIMGCWGLCNEDKAARVL